MNIDTMQDIIDNIELLKQREITYYEGHWCCFKVDSNGCGSVDNDIRLNDKLFNVLKDCEYIQKDGHTVSHRSVTQFKFSSKFDKVTATELNQFFLELIQHFHNKRFGSIRKITYYAKEKFDTFWHDYHYDYGSYWGGDRYCSVLLFIKDGIQIGIPYSSCGRTQLLKKNFIFRQLLRMYRQSNNLSWLNYADCPRIPNPEGRAIKRVGTDVVEQFWKDLGKVYPFTDEELSESIASKKAIIDEQYKEANSLSCAGV